MFMPKKANKCFVGKGHQNHFRMEHVDDKKAKERQKEENKVHMELKKSGQEKRTK